MYFICINFCFSNVKIFTARHPKDDGRLYFQSVHISGGGGVQVSVKGKIFDTRFGLIHVQTGKKIFVEGPPPPSKGKNF